jgi:hypothetical protein
MGASALRQVLREPPVARNAVICAPSAAGTATSATVMTAGAVRAHIAVDGKRVRSAPRVDVCRRRRLKAATTVGPRGFGDLSYLMVVLAPHSRTGRTTAAIWSQYDTYAAPIEICGRLVSQDDIQIDHTTPETIPAGRPTFLQCRVQRRRRSHRREARFARPQSSQNPCTSSASPARRGPITSSSRPSGPASNLRVDAGAIRIASRGPRSTISSSILARPAPDRTT